MKHELTLVSDIELIPTLSFKDPPTEYRTVNVVLEGDIPYVLVYKNT